MSTQAEASAVNSAIQDPVPELHPVQSVLANLQRGLIDPTTGTWYTDAEVREMTGADEEYLASLEAQESITYAEYMSSLLRRAVVRVGAIDITKTPDALDGLTIGDRDILFLTIVKATYGVEKTFQADCGSCGKSNDVTMNLDEDFPVIEPSINLRDPITVVLKSGSVVRLRVPTIADNTAVAKAGKSIAEQNTMMLSRCAVWGEDKPSNIVEWARNLNYADRNKLVKTLLNVTAGPKIGEVNVPCAHCKSDLTIRLDWISLLLS